MPHAYAVKVSHLPAVGSLFAAFLGYNPMRHDCWRRSSRQLPHATAAYLTGHRFFPTLVSHPFATGIHEAFYFAAGCCVVAAVASWLRGGKYFHVEATETERISADLAAEAGVAAGGRVAPGDAAGLAAPVDAAGGRRPRPRVGRPAALRLRTDGKRRLRCRSADVDRRDTTAPRSG